MNAEIKYYVHDYDFRQWLTLYIFYSLAVIFKEKFATQCVLFAQQVPNLMEW